MFIEVGSTFRINGCLDKVQNLRKINLSGVNAFCIPWRSVELPAEINLCFNLWDVPKLAISEKVHFGTESWL